MVALPVAPMAAVLAISNHRLSPQAQQRSRKGTSNLESLIATIITKQNLRTEYERQKASGGPIDENLEARGVFSRGRRGGGAGNGLLMFGRSTLRLPRSGS